LLPGEKEDVSASWYLPEAAILSPHTTSRGRVKLVLLMRFLFVCLLIARSDDPEPVAAVAV